MFPSYRFIDPPSLISHEKITDRDEMKMNQLIEPHQAGKSFDVGLVGVPLSRSSISVSGASETPNAIRLAWKYFTTYNIDFDIDLNHLGIADLGDIRMHWTNIPLCHQYIEDGTVELLEKNASFMPLFIGGDHSITCPIVKGMKRFHKGKRIGIIQFDTHFDLRDLKTGGPANGTPIRGLIESTTITGDQVVNIGLHGYYNTYSLKKYADQQNLKYYTLRQVRQAGIEKVVNEAVEYLRQRVDLIYVTVDIDVLDMAVSPGVPASTPGGLYTWELFEALYLLGKQENISGLDLVELDAHRDFQNQITIKTGAHAILNFLCGYVQRGDQLA